MRFTLIAFFFCIVSALSAQNDSLIFKDGKTYKVHLVQPKETLFGLSRIYQMSVTEIVDVNEGLSAETMQPGMQVLIPIKQENQVKQPAVSTSKKEHVTQKQETLFGISRKYNLTVQQLLDANPQVESEGLKEGMILIIPEFNTISAEPKPKTVQEKPDVMEMPATYDTNFIIHVVERGETLFSIAREYNTKADSIVKFNQLTDNIISIDQQLKIKRAWLGALDTPELGSTERKQEPTSRLDSLKIATKEALARNKGQSNFTRNVDTSIFSLGMLLPVNLRVEEFTKTREIALHYYQGFKMALDSLSSSAGLNADLFIFDSEALRDSFAIEKNLAQFDALIGPFFKEQFKTYQNFSSKRRIPLFAPVPHERKTLINQPNSVVLMPQNTHLAAVMGDYVGRKHHGDNIVIFDSGNIRDYDEKMATFKALNRAYLKHKSDSIQFSKFRNNAESIKSRLRPDRLNVIVVPSNESAYVSFITNTLMQIKGHKIMVYGLESWIKMDNLDADFKNDLKITFASGTRQNLPASRTLPFYQASREKYGYDLNEFGMQGFDLGMYLGTLYLKHGKSFAAHFNSNYLDPIYMPVKLARAGDNNGFENVASFMLQFYDYELIEVK
ncbi:MAG: PBP1 and LysM peptidoglycan-binding domain-containing protein [Luteibaculaceae bacterium]